MGAISITSGEDTSFERMRPHLFDQNNPHAKGNRLHAARESFYWFCMIYLSHYFTIAVAPFQRELFDLSKEERLLVVMPRGYGKSIVWSICYPLWVILNNPYGTDLKWQKEDIFTISNAGALAEKWIRYHKRELLENPRIQEDYAVSEGSIWRNDEIEVMSRGKLNGRIIARGSGAQIRGEHPTEVLLDDLENREEAASEGPRQKMREYFYQDLFGVLRTEHGRRTRMKVVGTFVHPMGLLPELYTQDWWVKRRYAVYNADGSPLWPEYKDDEALQELRRQTTETAWASEYMNQPIVSENPTFLREWFQGYEPGMIRDVRGNKIVHSDMMIVTAIDPAISQRDGADYTAITTYGVTWDETEPRIYCLDARRGHWSTSRQITELLASYEKFPGSVQLIETVAYQKALYYEYKDRLDRERLNIKVLEIVPDKDKGRRANAVTPLFIKGMVHFDYNDQMQQLLMDELALFDYSKTKHGRDDWVDATVYCLDHIAEWLRRKQRGAQARREPTIILAGRLNPQLYGERGAAGG